MVELLKSILFGIVEGITEWLPISSTGHLIILQRFLPLAVSEPFYNVFEVVIQLGAIMAVVVLYWEKIFPWKYDVQKKRIHTDKTVLFLWGKIIVACLPAAIVGVLFDDIFNKLFYNPFSVAVALIVFGLVFLFVEKAPQKSNKRNERAGEVTWGKSIFIGIFQLLAAIFPGTSRSGATIVGGLLTGCDRSTVTEFSFFLAIPVMVGASFLKIFRFGLTFSSLEIAILTTATAVSFVTSLFVIGGLISFVKKHSFKIFGWYRIVLGVAILMLHPFY